MGDSIVLQISDKLLVKSTLCSYCGFYHIKTYLWQSIKLVVSQPLACTNAPFIIHYYMAEIHILINLIHMSSYNHEIKGKVWPVLPQPTSLFIDESMAGSI